MECTKNIYLPGVGKKTPAGDEGTRVCPGHPLPVPQDRPCSTGPALPLALSRLLPPLGPARRWGCFDSQRERSSPRSPHCWECQSTA